MSERPEAGDPDDVDSMLNALQVSPQRGRNRAPEITPAPEAIAKAKQDAGGKKRSVGARTVPMGGAPPLPRDVINARVASDPAEQAFLNKTEESAPRRARNEKTMLTGMKTPDAPASSYLVSAAIAFVAVLAVGLIGWRVMKYMESQAPAREDSTGVSLAGKPASTAATTVSTAPAANASAATTAATTALPPSTGAPSGATAATVPAATTAAAVTTASSKPAGKPAAATGSVAPSQASSAPSGKYGGMVSPELQ